MRKMIHLAILIAALMGFVAPVMAQTPILMGYYADWSPYAPNNPNYYPGNYAGNAHTNPELKAKLQKVNAVAYAFLEVNDSGIIYFNDPWSDLATKDLLWCISNEATCNSNEDSRFMGNFDAFADPKNMPNVKYRIASIGGYGHIQSYLNAVQHPQAFANSLKAIADHFGINGVDLDFEPLSQIDPDRIIILAKTIRETLGSNFIITMPISVNHLDIAHFGAVNWSKLMRYVNYVGIMGYDMHGEFDNPRVTAMHSQLFDPTSGATDFSDDTAVKTLIAMGVSPNKMILGVPAYGRAVAGVSGEGIGQTFTQSFHGDLDAVSCSLVPNQGSSCGGMISYRKLDEDTTLSLAKYTQVNNKINGAYANAYSDVFVSFDDEKSIADKVDYVKTYKIAGMLVWTLGSDVPVNNPHSLIAKMSGLLGI